MPSAIFNLPFNLNIPDAVPTNLPPEVRSALSDLYNAVQQIQYVFHTNLGIGQRLSSLWADLPVQTTMHQSSVYRYYGQASETVNYAAAINLHDSGGLLQIRNANATDSTRPCHGFCTTSGGIVSGNFGEVVCFQGILTGLAGLTRGTRYFLSTVNGLITATAPIAPGNIEQPVALAFAPDILVFNIGLDYIQH